MSQTLEILADATYNIFNKLSVKCKGNCFTDEDVLIIEGITVVSKYSVVPEAKFYRDLFCGLKDKSKRTVKKMF